MNKSLEELRLLEYNLAPSVRAFTTTRNGGVSTGAYASFNITHYCGDSAECVSKNREILCNELHISNESLILPHQTHSSNVQLVTSEFFNMTKEEKNNFLYDVDALVTNMKNICIGVSTADCVPVLLFDEKTETIAAIHAGWRGVVNNIVAATIEQMSATFSTSAEHLKVVIGPSISQKSFEVGDEVYDAFEKANFDMASIAVRASQLGLSLSVEGEDKWHIDLWAAITMQLLEKGVELNNITISNICTFEEHEEYFSARRNGISSGRLFTGIMMTE